MISLRLIYLAPVLQRLDNAIHRINRYPADHSVNKTNRAIRWIVIYPVDSVIQPLDNWGQEFYILTWIQVSIIWDVFNKTITPLALIEYEMIITNSEQRV